MAHSFVRMNFPFQYDSIATAAQKDQHVYIISNTILQHHSSEGKVLNQIQWGLMEYHNCPATPSY